jgi:hypothetical protein
MVARAEARRSAGLRISPRLMPHTVGVKRQTGLDEYGKPVYGSAVAYPFSRVIHSERYIAGPDRTTVLRSGLVLFSAAPDITAGDLVVLPTMNGFPAGERRVLLVGKGLEGGGAAVYTRVDYA